MAATGVALAAGLSGCTTVDRVFAACVAADVAAGMPVPGVALAGSVAGVTACR